VCVFEPIFWTVFISTWGEPGTTQQIRRNREKGSDTAGISGKFTGREKGKFTGKFTAKKSIRRVGWTFLGTSKLAAKFQKKKNELAHFLQENIRHSNKSMNKYGYPLLQNKTTIHSLEEKTWCAIYSSDIHPKNS